MAEPDGEASGIADRIASSVEASTSSHSSSSGPVWQREWFSVLPELEEWARRGKGIRDVAVMRASQLDAGRLDTELTAMLREQFMRIFSLLQPRVISAFQPELTLLLDFLIFRFTVWSGRPTPGSALMNLRYRDERQSGLSPSAAPRGEQGALPKSATAAAQEALGRSGLEGPGLNRTQRTLYGLGVVFLRYLWARADQFSAAQHWGDLPRGSWGWLAWRGMRGAETAFKVASLANFLAFLRFGKYRSVLERVLGARLVYERGSMARALSFEYLNRQLVWHELSELLLFLLPLLNVQRIKAFVMARLPRIAPPPASGATAGPAMAGSTSGSAQQQQQGCLICGAAEMAVPYSALPCGHAFCYYCLRAHTLADPAYKCPQCGAAVTALRRWRPGITWEAVGS